MNSHKLLLPLAETESDSPSELSIKVYDIWYFERSQVHNNPSYDESFALQLLNRIEQLIAARSKPDFVVDPNGKESGYQLNKQSLHSSKYADIRERFALEFFFLLDSYYSYSKEILVTPSDDEFWYWFSLKLRQYDLSLERVNEFLNFQLKRYSIKGGSDFIEMLELCIIQYPHFFSDRLLQTVNVWINKNKKKAVSLNVAQSYNVLQSSKSKPSRSLPEFAWKDGVNKEKQLEYLHSNLESKGYIEKIELTNFKKHFNGYFEDVPKINWLSSQYGLIYLIDKLKPYLNRKLYTGKNGSIAIAHFEKHFQYKGKAINTSSWRKVKSENQGVENVITKHMDHIISHL
jgi:hypothetical protein